VCIWKLRVHIYVASHDKLCHNQASTTYCSFDKISSSEYVLSDKHMFFKEIFFKQHILLNNIYTKQHILFNTILCYTTNMGYDIYVQQHKYVYQQHTYVVEFYKTYIYCDIEQHICDPWVTYSWLSDTRGASVTDGGPLNSASKTPCFYFRCLFTEHGSHYNSSLFCHESLVSSHVPRFGHPRWLVYGVGDSYW